MGQKHASKIKYESDKYIDIKNIGKNTGKNIEKNTEKKY